MFPGLPMILTCPTIRFMRHLLPIVLLLVIGLPLSAEQEKQQRTCRILVLSAPGSVPASLHLFDGLASQEVELPRMNLSPVYKLVAGPAKLRLLDKPVLDPRNVPAEAPSVILQADMEHIYLLVSADRSNPVAPVKMAVVNANHDQIGRGEMLWFNLTDKTVAGTLGSRTLRIAPGANQVIKEPARDREDYAVELYFRMPGDDFPHPLFETRWRHDPRSRSLAFIVTEGKRRVPRVFTFTDYRARAEAEADGPP